MDELQLVGHGANAMFADNVATKFDFLLGKAAFGTFGIKLFFV